MALRPRTEMLNIQLEWWKLRAHPGQTLFATAYAALNLAYLSLLHLASVAGAERLVTAQLARS